MATVAIIAGAAAGYLAIMSGWAWHARQMERERLAAAGPAPIPYATALPIRRVRYYSKRSGKLVAVRTLNIRG